MIVEQIKHEKQNSFQLMQIKSKEGSTQRAEKKKMSHSKSNLVFD